MYYISRRDASGKVYVVDTEDGVEEYVTKEDLFKLHRAGVHIEGLHVERYSGGTAWLRTEPYRPVSKQRAELLMQYGVDTAVTPNGLLTILTFTSGHSASRVILSDICKVVGANSINYSKLIYDKVVLVADDKLTAFEKKWFGSSADPLVVDLTAVTKKDLLVSAYMSLLTYPDSIIDKPDRFEKLYFYYAIKEGVLPVKWLAWNKAFPDAYILDKCKSDILRGISNVTAVCKVNSRHQMYMGKELISVIHYLICLEERHVFTPDEAKELEYWLSKLKLGKARSAFSYVVFGGMNLDIRLEVARLAKYLYEEYY